MTDQTITAPRFQLPPDDYFSSGNDGEDPYVSRVEFALRDGTFVVHYLDDQKSNLAGVCLPRLNADIKRRRLLGTLPDITAIFYYFIGSSTVPDVMWVYDLAAVVGRGLDRRGDAQIGADWQVN
jgi:hypothetical protein